VVTVVGIRGEVAEYDFYSKKMSHNSSFAWIVRSWYVACKQIKSNGENHDLGPVEKKTIHELITLPKKEEEREEEDAKGKEREDKKAVGT
jgi:hypothetical protein